MRRSSSSPARVISAAPHRCWRFTATDARPIRPPAVTGAPFLSPGPGGRTSVQRAHGVLVGRETRRPLLAVGGQALLHVRAAEPQKFLAKGRLEGRREHPVPMVEAVFGEANRRLRALRQ